MEKGWNRSFEMIVGVLLNISLAAFLFIIVERINTLKGFIFDTITLTIMYVGTMYYLTYNRNVTSSPA